MAHQGEDNAPSLEPSSHEILQSATEVHDPRGDITLVVGDPDSSSKVFVACSRTLARSSLVFDRMLYGSMSESQQTQQSGQWTVSLLSDDPQAFKLWSSIAHGRFSGVPRELTTSRLYALTKLSHYYDATLLLSPWISTWLASLPHPAAENESQMYKLLWIAMELGHPQLYESTARTIVLECPNTVDEEVISMEFEGVPIQDHIRHCRDVRLSTITSMLSLFSDLCNILVVVDEKPRWCRHASYMGPHRCESMILGSVTFCLTRAGLWPLPEPENVQESVLGLFRKLTGIVVHDIGQAEKKGQDHRECNPRQFLIDRLQRILAEMADCCPEGQRAKVREQATRLEDNTRS